MMEILLKYLEIVLIKRTGQLSNYNNMKYIQLLAKNFIV